MDIGFIGLGSMGSAMALNALKAGHTVRVWNRSREATKALAAAGCERGRFAGRSFLGRRGVLHARR